MVRRGTPKLRAKKIIFARQKAYFFLRIHKVLRIEQRPKKVRWGKPDCGMNGSKGFFSLTSPIRPTYIPLRIHSAYSLLEGAIPIKTLIQQAKEKKIPALGLTDTGNLFGALEFSLACAAEGIQPILGCQIRLHPFTQEGSGPLSAPWSLALYAQNERGYRNLIKLASRSTVDQDNALLGRITLEQLSGLTEGLLCLSGGTEGPLNQAFAKGALSDAEQAADIFQRLFPDRFYLELGRYGWPGEEKIEEHLLTLADGRQLPLVATNEAYFPTPEAYEAHDALLCIAEGTYVNQPHRRRLTPNHFFKSPQEMGALFQDVPEALTNTVAIARRCHFLLKPVKPLLPPFETFSGRNEADELRYQASAGLENRLQNHVFKPDMGPEDKQALRQQYAERLAYETDMIIDMGFSGYFLIVADFIQWAKRQGIPVGPGRGSGASSLVAWALTITDVDPIRFGLFFERFLNPERVSLPDFDVDFCQERRDEVIVYVREKYGADKVAHIITFGKLQARAVLRDVGRVLQMPYTQVDRICKLIPQNPTNPVTLGEAIEKDPQLQQMEKEDPQVRQLLNFGRQLEGLYRHASTHAAGVVIAGQPLEAQVPLYQDSRAALPATQFNMKYVEQAGLIKFDFLGLKTLTVLQHTVDLLKKRGIEIDLSAMPLDDAPTFALLNRLDVVGVFQVESGGMREVLRRLRPERFEELIALVALYRPGPMDDIPRYIACRHGEEKVHYTYPCLESILKETFGVMVYQEQVLQIARVLAGYSLGSADLLRRAMGKKIKSEMAAQRKIFVEGTLKQNGGDRSVASHLFDQIAKFAGYAFPKAHSAPYALLLYQTAYLKANYPVEFMAASLTLDAQNMDKLAIFARETASLGIPLLPPDINQSGPLFQVESLVNGTLAIRYGLAAIKNVGHAAMEEVVAERNKNGPFSCIYDCMERLGPRVINKRQMEALVAAGVFDSLHPNRQQLMLSVDLLLRYGTVERGGLFETHETRPPLMETADWPTLERLRQEFHAIGFYLSAHPLDAYRQSLANFSVILSNSLENHLQTAPEGSLFQVAGILMSKQERMGRSGKKYAFLQLSDPTGVYEVTVFSELLSQYRDLLQAGQPLLLSVSGRLEGEAMRLVAQRLESLDDVMIKSVKTLVLTTNNPQTLPLLAEKLNRAQPGKTTIMLRFLLPSGTAIYRLPQAYQVAGDLKADLEAIPHLTVEAA